MEAMKLQTITSAGVFLVVAISQSLATAQLTADFSLNTSSMFSATTQSGMQARAAVSAAIADLNDALNQNLGAIPASASSFSGTSGNDSASIDFVVRVRNPSTNEITNVSIASGSSVVRIFIGARPQSAGVLGIGGPGGGVSSTAEAMSISNIDDVETALNNAASAATETFSRGEGPVIVTIDGNLGPFSYQVPFGLLVGNVSFNSSINNFHLDHTTLPPANLIDLYSVTLHETMHAIGLGPSEEWQNRINGSTWTGPAVISLQGSGAGVLAPDLGHVNQNVMSPRIADGVPQQSVLAPLIPGGTRLNLTALDLAFMRDIGFPNANAVIPPPPRLGDFDMDGAVDLADLDQYNGNIGVQAVGALLPLDLDEDGNIGEDDFETHYTTLVETSNGNTGTRAGDINLDGEVDVLCDAFILVGNLGNSSANSWSQGDLNGDGTINILEDAFLLIANLGFDNG